MTQCFEIGHYGDYSRSDEVYDLDGLYDVLYDRYMGTDEWEAFVCEGIDEIYPPYEIGSISFNASQILKELDPIAFDITCGEELDALAEEVRDALESGTEYQAFDGTTFRIVDSDEEDSD